MALGWSLFREITQASGVREQCQPAATKSRHDLQRSCLDPAVYCIHAAQLDQIVPAVGIFSFFFVRPSKASSSHATVPVTFQRRAQVPRTAPGRHAAFRPFGHPFGFAGNNSSARAIATAAISLALDNLLLYRDGGVPRESTSDNEDAEEGTESAE